MTLAQQDPKIPGALMRAEAAEAPGVFRATVTRELAPWAEVPRAIYSIARGSSDAAACMLWYEYMARLGIPVTSLPPSAFSLLGGVAMADTMAMIVSQSGGSDDLVRSAEGARAKGAKVVSLVNVENSPVAAHSDLTVSIGAGPELAVPATKSVIGAVAAGMAFLRALDPGYGDSCLAAGECFAGLADRGHDGAGELRAALLRAQHVYVIGRGSGFGAAQEVALKLKETCALHAEAYSASEVLHGPLQLVTKPLLILMLDTGAEETQPSMDQAESRFREARSTVYRLRPEDLGAGGLAPPAAAAVLLHMLYPVILETALALGFDPDAPANLAKVTRTL